MVSPADFSSFSTFDGQFQKQLSLITWRDSLSAGKTGTVSRFIEKMFHHRDFSLSVFTQLSKQLVASQFTQTDTQGLSLSLRKMFQNTSFLWRVYSHIKTKPTTFSLYGNIRQRKPVLNNQLNTYLLTWSEGTWRRMQTTLARKLISQSQWCSSILACRFPE